MTGRSCGVAASARRAAAPAVPKLGRPAPKQVGTLHPAVAPSPTASRRAALLVAAATVKDGAALDRKLRVAVIGGGPSGACAAETLAEGGVETFLIERKMDNCKVSERGEGSVMHVCLQCGVVKRPRAAAGGRGDGAHRYASRTDRPSGRRLAPPATLAAGTTPSNRRAHNHHAEWGWQAVTSRLQSRRIGVSKGVPPRRKPKKRNARDPTLILTLFSSPHPFPLISPAVAPSRSA